MAVPKATLTTILDEYRERAKRAGSRYRCLEDGGKPSDALEVKAEENTVRIMGPFDGGWFGVSAEEVIAAMESVEGDELNVVIDSPGGFLTEGMSLYSYMRDRAAKGTNISTRAQGLVASAAIMPYIAGEDRSMADGAMLMVHNPWSFLLMIGDADSLEKGAAKEVKALRAMGRNYARQLAKRTGMTEAEATEQMRDETWLDADEAVEHGYAQEVEAKAESGAKKAKSGIADRRMAEIAHSILRGHAA